MSLKALGSKKVVLAFWVLAFFAVSIRTTFGAGWDVAIYRTAIDSLKAGRDPYLDTIAKQTAYHDNLLLHPDTGSDRPNGYIYSPVTLPLLSLIGKIPPGISGPVYWILYSIGALTILWFGLQAAEDEERAWLSYFAPMALFFPGLLENKTLLSGNVAYLVYGSVLPATVIGWKREQWQWFYSAVLVASCFKAPYLTLLAIPVLSHRKQWLAASIAGSAGIALMAAQAILRPVLFRHFLQAVDSQMIGFRDYGSSPAGILAGYMLDHRLDSLRGGLFFYLLYALPLFGFLFFLSRKFLDGAIPWTRWIPALLLGVMLLSPRIQEYDLVVLTIPMALIVRRSIAGSKKRMQVTAWVLAAFILANVAGSPDDVVWKDIACAILISSFGLAVWQMFHRGMPSDLARVPSAANLSYGVPVVAGR